MRDEFDAIFVGALGDPRVPDHRHARDILLGIRFELDLYVNYRPVRLFDERLCPLKNRTPDDVRFVVFRENTEGLYVNAGGRLKPGTEDEVAIQEEINTWKGVHRIVRHAFDFARARGLTRVCMADKSNALTYGHALWQRVFKEVAADYPGIEPRHLYIDALVLLMVQDPSQFEVIVTNNLFGDIVTDLAAALQGGPRDGGVGQPASGPHVDVRAGPRVGAAARRAGTWRIRAGPSSRPRCCSRRSGGPRRRTPSKPPCDAPWPTGEVTPDVGGALGTRETGEAIAYRGALTP